MKEHTMSYFTEEINGTSPAPADFFRHAKAAFCSPVGPAVGNTGCPATRFRSGAGRTWSSLGAFFSLRALLVILIVTAIGFIGPVAPAQSQMDVDLREAVESHNAGRTREAIDIYTEVLEKNPRSVEALNWRGMAYDDLGKLDEALADLNKALKLSPNYADAYNNRGEVHRKKKMYRQALADYSKAAALDKKFAEPHFNMAIVYEQQRKNKKAAGELSQYLKFKPNAEDKKEIEAKIKALGAPGQAAKPRGASVAKKPPVRTAAKPGDRPGVKPGAKAWKKPAKKPEPPGGIPGLEQVPIPPEAMAVIGGLGIAAAILPIVFYIFGAVMLFLIAKKTATSLPWLAFIPILNIFLMVMIAGKPIWWLALLLLPILSPLFGMLAAADPTGGILPLALSGIAALVSIVAWLFICLGIAQARGKSVIWGVLLFIPCTNPIALGYLGLSR